MNDNERTARGHRAAREYAEVEAAFQAVETAIFRTLTETPVGQEAKVLNLHKALQNLSAVRQAIRSVIDDGLMAEAAIAAAGLTRAS